MTATNMTSSQNKWKNLVLLVKQGDFSYVNQTLGELNCQ